MVDFVDGKLHELVNYHARLSQLDILVLAQPFANHFQGFLLLKELVLVFVRMLLYQLKLGLITDIVLCDIKDKLLVDGLLRAVRKLRGLVREEGSGHNYLIQHSAGSGKTKTMAWIWFIILR